MEGWISLDRKLEEHWIWKNTKYTRAWIHCLFRANFKDTKVLINGELQLVLRGEFITSIHKFSEEVGMSIQEVRTFWKLLEKDSMIVKNSTKEATKLKVCNYEHYQDTQQRKQQSSNKPTTTENKDNKVNKTFLLACAQDKEGKNYVPEEVLECIPPELKKGKFIHVWDTEWAPFREGRNVAAYQVPGGLKQTLSGLRNRVKGDTTKAIAAIRYSIEMNYQGIFLEKEYSSTKKSGGKNRYKSKTGIKYKQSKNLQDE